MFEKELMPERCRINPSVIQDISINQGITKLQRAARTGDHVVADVLTDPDFFAWLEAIKNFTGIDIPTSITARIDSGSKDVTIGGNSTTMLDREVTPLPPNPLDQG